MTPRRSNTAGNAGRRGRGRLVDDQRGSALILVMLILMGLSAVGMVALQDVARSVQQSGNFKARAVADTFSDAVSQFMAKRVGDKANSMWGAMKTFQDFDIQGATGSNAMTKRKRLMTQGAAVELRQNPANNIQDFGDMLKPISGKETGLFTDGTTAHRSFESMEETTNFRVIIRDPVDGIPVPGYSEKYCFKKVTIAAESQVGELKSDWTEPRQVGVGRTLVEALMGPIECGSQ